MKKIFTIFLCLISIMITTSVFAAKSTFGDQIALACYNFVYGSGPNQLQMNPDEIKEWNSDHIAGTYVDMKDLIGFVQLNTGNGSCVSAKFGAPIASISCNNDILYFTARPH